MASAGTVTVLCTDIVGSTELRAAVGENAADDLRREHDRLVTDEVVRHGGTVVKGMGDGFLATFTGASDAVEASIAVHQAVHAWGALGAQPLRIGVSAGDVTWEGDDCFGTPVIEASRLCARASGGQTIVADVVRVLARGRHGQTLAPVGALELKGLPEPVMSFEVPWLPRGDPSGLPLPIGLAADSEFPYVGRDEQRAQLLKSWTLGLEGSSQLVFVSGEPGIGKSRLMAELARVLYDDGATVLHGRCDDDVALSYQPFVEALQHYANHSTRLGGYAGDLVRLCPDLARIEDLPPALQSDPEAERRRLYDAVVAWLRDAAGERPVLLAIDDAHWADAGTLSLLRYLVRALGDASVTVVATYRDTELGRTHPLADTLAALRERPDVARVALAGLDERAIGDLFEEPADAALIHAVFDETEGNPFFAREVVRHLRESGAIELRDGRWELDRPLAGLGIPAGVREVVGRRLARLSQDAQAACSVAAVVGSEFTVPVLAAVSERDEDVLVAALDEVVRARLLHETGIGRYRFAHSLVRSTLYDELGLTARVRMHRKVGLALEAVAPDDVTALAYHFGQAAASGEERRAARYGLLAARRALGELAVEQARQSTRGALAFLGDADEPELRCDLLTCQGTADRMVGDPTHRETLIEAARLAQTIGDTDRLVEAVIVNVGGVSDTGGFDEERVALIEAALAVMPSDDSARRAELLAALAYGLGPFLLVSDHRAEGLAEEALAMARRVGDPRTLTTVLHNYFDATWYPETLPQRLATTAENLALAEQLEDPVALGRALQDDAFARAEIGDLSGFMPAFERIDQLGKDFELRAFSGLLDMMRASMALLAGRLVEAEAFAVAAFEQLVARGHRSALAFHFAQLLGIRREQGRLEELLPLVEQVEGTTPAVLVAKMLILSDLGRHDEARVLLAELAVDRFAPIRRDWLWLAAISNCAEVAGTLSSRAEAATLYGVLEPFRDRLIGHVFISGAAARYTAIAAATSGRYAEAEALFGEAEAMESGLGAVTCLARTRVAHARMLLACGEGERARELVEQVVTVARASGLPAVERDAATLLA